MAGHLRPSSAAAAIVLLCATALFSGCLGAGDEPKASLTGAPSATPSPTGTAGVSTTPPSSSSAPLVDVDEESAIFAAIWSAGRSWTYDVSGTLFPASYSAVIGVMSVEDDRYEMGTDSDEELKNAAHNGNGLFLGDIQKDSLSINHEDTYQDLYGFFRPLGATWDATLFGTGFRMLKNATGPVTHALGSSQGLLVTGTGPEGQTLLVEYATDVGGLSHFLWLSGETVVLEYKLTGFAATGATSGLRQWAVLSSRWGDASGAPNHLGVEQWPSDGAGDVVFVRMILKPTTVARAILLDPAGNVAASAEGSTAETVQTDTLLADQSGTWNIVMFTDAGTIGSGPTARIDVYVYQIAETAA